MFPAKCYCFNVAKIDAAISLERVKKCDGRVNKMHGIGSEYALLSRPNH